VTIAGLLSFALVYFVFVVTPGPGVAAVIARGLGNGLRHGVPFAAGFVLGDIVWFTIAATGLAALANSFAVGFTVLKFAGCAYLFYLAWKMWKTPVANSDVEASQETTAAWSSFAGSLSLTLSNPKVIVFFISLMPLVTDVAHMNLQSYLATATVMAVVCSATIGANLLLANRARRIFKSAKALQRINRGSAVMMAGAAGMIAVKG
jgi:threonine/homoserine/homoserine lactone efflux protein